MKITKVLALILASLLCLAAFASCTAGNGTEEGSDTTSNSSGEKTEIVRFDYFGNDMTVYISIDESEYKASTVTLPKECMPGRAGVLAYIDMLCESYKTSTGNKITDRPIAKGDVVMLYYEGYLNGEKFSGGSNMSDANPHALEIGSGSFIPGFEEALIGIIPAETSKENLVDLNLKFPDSYHSADLAGKEVVFKVYVEYIDEIAPAEYNEKFITETLQYTTDKEDVKASFEEYLEYEIIPSVRKSEIINAVWEKLFDAAVVIKYPGDEVQYYYNQYVSEYEYYRQYFAYMGQSFQSLDEFVAAYLGLADGEDWKKITTENAEIDVTQNLLFHYIAQMEGLIITDADYQASVQYYIDYYKAQGQTLTAADVESYFGSRMIKEQALFDKVNTFLVDKCTVTYDESDGNEESTEDTTDTTEDTDTTEIEIETGEAETEETAETTEKREEEATEPAEN